MKKLVLTFIAFTVLCFAACGNKSDQCSVADTDTVVVDSVAMDTIVVDSVK